jgi:glycosyltransferase involved in cell wall biosynthesis
MSTALPGIAVVIPVRNGRAHLPDAIESAGEQVPPPAELIVVDDGSTDGSGEVARALGARVVTQAPFGPGAARNLGVSSATSDLVAFLDADDRMAPGRLEIQGAALAADETLDGTFGLMRRFADGTGTYGAAERCLLPSAFLTRRRFFVESGGFDPALPAGEFVDWMVRCREMGRRFHVVDAVVAERRVHEGNLTRDRERLRVGYLAVARSAVDRRRLAEATRPTDDAP